MTTIDYIAVIILMMGMFCAGWQIARYKYDKPKKVVNEHREAINKCMDHPWHQTMLDNVPGYAEYVKTQKDTGQYLKEFHTEHEIEDIDRRINNTGC